jgi:hypothetical protein
MPITLNGTAGVTYPDGVTQASGVPNASATLGAPLVSNGTIYTQNTAVGVAFGGTGATATTGSGNNVLSTSPTLVTPILGTPQSGTLTSCTGLPLSTGVTGTLPVANGGTGTSTPSLVAGSGISVSGSFPNQTIAATSSVNTNQLVKAWVRFDARSNPVTIQASYNISSVTYIDSSTYTLNFTTAMPNGNYAASGMGEWRNGVSNAGVVCMDRNYPPSASSLTVAYFGAGGNTNLYYYVNVAVFSA